MTLNECHHEGDVCGFERNIATATGWMVIRFSVHIHVPVRMIEDEDFIVKHGQINEVPIRFGDKLLAC